MNSSRKIINNRVKRSNAGFTLVEMLMVIAIFGFVLAAVSQMFISTLRTHRQQSRITESNIEGIIGLELLRQDLEKAGYGLPWNMGGFTYDEAAGNPHGLNQTTEPPRAIVNRASGGLNGSDYLVVRASNVATNTVCSKWTFLHDSLSTNPTTSWTPDSENFSNTDWVIVISPGTPDSPSARTLISDGIQFGGRAAFQAPPLTEARVIYGIDKDTDLMRPFNRADFYVKVPSSSEMPKRCAPGTGILYKAVVSQSPPGSLQEMPLLDCVADMQVAFHGVVISGGTTSTYDYQDSTTLTATEIRDQIKEARVFILTHEGQRDTSYQHPRNTEYVGGNDFDFSSHNITNWQNYRWKVYTLVVQLNNLK